jgi:response regulator RpfG family c-di-GMP phosphodiesterase
MITRLFGPPRLVVPTSLAMFTVVAIVLTAVLLLIAIQGSGYVRGTVTDKLATAQRMLFALEQRQSRELQAQVAVVAESPTLKAAIDTYQAEIRRSDANTRAELIRTIERELDQVASRIQPDIVAVSDPAGNVLAVAGRYQQNWPSFLTPTTTRERETIVTLPSGVFRRVSDIDILRPGALLHDIGKIGISDHVLRKPGALTDEEFELIKEHPALGARILRTVPFLTQQLPIVELHHERPDGRGYPYGLTAEEIPMLARIVHVADAFDALISARAYRPALDSGYAIRELWRCAGTQFDAEVVQAVAVAGPGTQATQPAADVATLATPRRLALVPARS